MPSGPASLVRRRLARGASPPRAQPPAKRRQLLVSGEVPEKLRTGTNLRFVTVTVPAPKARTQPPRPVTRPVVTPRLASTVARRMGQRLRERAVEASVVIPEVRFSAMEETGLGVYVTEIPSSSIGLVKMRLGQLGRTVTGAKKARQLLTKRARARRRQSQHTFRLRASLGQNTILENLSAAPTTLADYRKRVGSFLAFLDLHRLPHATDRHFDLATSDWADLGFLSGEGYEAGEKLLAAMGRWALQHRDSGVLQLPRFLKVLRSWKKNAPRASRLPMPEEFMWVICGTLGYANLVSMALYHAILFSTYLRPSVRWSLQLDDLVTPRAEDKEVFHVLVISAVERLKSIKTGTYDETVVLDGNILPELGRLLQEHVERCRAAQDDAAAAEAGVPVPPGDFSLREFLPAWRGAARVNKLEAVESVYQARHDGAPRDFLVKSRTAPEIQLRLHQNTTSAFKIYHKPGRIQQLVNTLDKDVLQYAGS